MNQSAARSRWYAGIGSRETPEDALQLLEGVAEQLALAGWGLRSGGARGADIAFEAGSKRVDGERQIFLPVANYGGRREGIDASSLPVASEAEAIARGLHPAWYALHPIGRRLMARNVNQVLGPDLQDPVRFVVCWAKGSRMQGDRVIDVAGGTGLAVRLAAVRGIRVFNVALPEHRARLEAWLEGLRVDQKPSYAP